MARIHELQDVGGETMLPSLGMLVGSYAGADVFGSIQAEPYKSFFGNDLDHLRKEFFDRHIRPMEELNFNIARTVNLIINPDNFRILNTHDDFRSIPTCMELPILMFKPIYDYFQEGRVEGFGYDPATLPDEDVWGRLIDNFTCEDVAEASDAEGYYEITATLDSGDPELSDDELYAIRRTREYILDKILNETDRDPTAIDLMRG